MVFGMSSHYPSFYSHHYEQCDGDDEELDVLESRLMSSCSSQFHFLIELLLS